MPTYEYPAVYVTEIASGVRPIEGVPTSTASFLGPDCIARIRARIANMPPSWTDAGRSDPGIAMLELMAWLAESLQHRTGAVPARAARSLSRIAAASLQSLDGRRLPKGSALRKVEAFGTKVGSKPPKRISTDGRARLGRRQPS